MGEAELISAGMSLLKTVVELISQAVAGDTKARARIRRVEEVLKDSPTDRAWSRAMDIAAQKGRAETIPPPAPPGNPFDEGGR